MDLIRNNNDDFKNIYIDTIYFSNKLKFNKYFYKIKTSCRSDFLDLVSN